MTKTDKQALSLMSLFAILMIISVVLPAKAATTQPIKVNTGASVKK